MTIESLINTAGPYTGNGTTDTYAYGFKITDANQLRVIETTDLGAQSILVLDTDYSVTGVGLDAGGSVIRTAGNLPTDYTWYIVRVPPLLQETDYDNQGDYFPETHELSFDEAMIIAQYLNAEIQKSVRFSINEDTSFFDVTLPSPMADQAIVTNATNDGFEFVARSSIGTGEVGTDIQAWSTLLDAIAGLTPTDGLFIVGDGSTFVGESGATARASLGLVIGTNVQAQSALLSAIAGLTPTDGVIIVGDGASFVGESGATARTSLGLGTGDDVTFNDIFSNNGLIRSGVADTTRGVIQVMGDAAASSLGGVLRLYLAADYDTVFEYFAIDAFQDDLRIFTSDSAWQTIFKGDTGEWRFPSEVIIGSTTVTPDGTLHVHTASAGTVAASTVGDDLIVENSSDGGISILTPDANISYLIFGSPTDNTGARVQYNYTARTMKLGTSVSAGIVILSSGDLVEAMRIDANQNVVIGDISADCRFHVRDDVADFIAKIESTEPGASPAIFELHRNSASPAVNDLLFSLRFSGRDSGLSYQTYAQIQSKITNVTDTTEQAQMLFGTSIAGAYGTRLVIEDGIWTTGATGGDQGADTINTSEIWLDGACKLGVEFLQFEVVAPTTDVATGTSLVTFTMPFDGTFLQSDTDLYQLFAVTDTAGVTGTMVVDIHLNGTTIMTTNKLDIETSEVGTATATTQPDLTTTTFSAGDKLTIDIDAIHTTAAKGLRVGIAVQRTSNG